MKSGAITALALVVAACGGAAETGATSRPEVEQSTTAAVPSETQEAPTTTTSAVPETSVVAPVSDPLVGQWCEAAQSERFDPSEAAAVDVFDPDALRSFYGQLDDQLDEWAADAPVEISEDVQVVAAAVRTFVAAFEEVDWDITSVSADSVAVLEDPAVLQAFERIDSYSAEQCGLEGPDADTPVAPEEALTLQAPDALMEFWDGLDGAYVLFVHADAGIEEYEDLDGMDLFVAFIESDMILGDAAAFIEFSGLSMELVIQNNPGLYADDLLGSTDRVGFMVPEVAQQLEIDGDSRLQRVELEPAG